MAVSFKLTGTTAMSRRLDGVRKSLDRTAEVALREEAEEVMRRAKDEFVPIDESTLKNSGKVANVERSGKDISVQLEFGGAASAYAIAVHEHPSAASPTSWKGGQVTFRRGGPKFLERPLMEAVPGMDGRIARRVKAA